jgi:hypothetical protein
LASLLRLSQADIHSELKDPGICSKERKKEEGRRGKERRRKGGNRLWINVSVNSNNARKMKPTDRAIEFHGPHRPYGR